MSEQIPPQRQRRLPWWKHLLLAVATIGMPGPAAREMRRQMEKPPTAHGEPLDRTGKAGVWIAMTMFYLAAGGVTVFVAYRLLFA
jgi:hypothetical protein